MDTKAVADSAHSSSQSLENGEEPEFPNLHDEKKKNWDVGKARRCTRCFAMTEQKRRKKKNWALSSDLEFSRETNSESSLLSLSPDAIPGMIEVPAERRHS